MLARAYSIGAVNSSQKWLALSRCSSRGSSSEAVRAQKLPKAMGCGGLSLAADDEAVTDMGMRSTAGCQDRLISKQPDGNLEYLDLIPA